MSDDTVSIEINGQPFQARKGQMVIEVADDAGIRIPRFCYHKKLSVAANCRMCLVEVEKAPKPLPACATPVMDGMKVFTRSKLALKAQKIVMEFLLINHPLDCPICDQGGECELQDVAMGYGKDLSRFTERKRVVKDKNLGPLIATDMTRCIHCTRCVRFGEEIGGMPELGATGRSEHVEIGTFIEGSVDSEMSGNVIDLCPVGALTSKPFRFRARAWEMRQLSTVAPHDPVGSNIHLHIGRNRVLRVVPRENEAINEVWLSDRDRFSYEGLYADDRLGSPMIRQNGRLTEVDWESALDFVARGLRAAAAKGGDRVGALVSPSATLEELYLVQKLLRGLGSNSVDHRLRQSDFSDQDKAPAYPALGQSIAELEQLDAVLLVGSNARKEHPIVNHRLRKAAMRGAEISLLNCYDYDFNLRRHAGIVARPSALARELLAVAAAAGADKDALKPLLGGIKPGAEHERIGKSLASAQRAAVLLGPAAINHPRAAVLRGLAAALARGCGARLGFLGEGGNAAGAWIAGAVPHRGPAAEAMDTPGADAGKMIATPRSAYVLLGVEPESDMDNPAAALGAMAAADFVVSLSCFCTPAMEQYASAVLPVAAFAETSGTLVNMEGVWQSFEGVAPAPGEARPAWKVLRVLGNLLEQDDFNYLASTDVRDEVRARAGDSAMPEQATWSTPQALAADGKGIERVGDLPPYAVDPLVRRARALQQTRDARPAEAAVSPELAKSLGVSAGDKVSLSQNGHSVTATLSVDGRVPDGCVRVPAATAIGQALGAAFGDIEVSKP
jgi:NADH-quinone oxidoreductase subunit G